MTVLRLLAAAFLILFLSACVDTTIRVETFVTHEIDDTLPVAVPETIVPVHVRITPKEAEKMMQSDAIILDVRTQEEFDHGHIRDAVLLPLDELREHVGDVIPGKYQTILVYCRTGRRSSEASHILIDMGFINVFDFGGIVDWHGEIVWSATDAVFFNYFGGGLPDDVVTPIDFAVTKRINSELPYFTFRFLGETVQEYRFNSDRTRFSLSRISDSEIYKIVITDENGGLIQEITDLSLTDSFDSWQRTLKFEDWSFDGYLDFALPHSSFWATAFFFWDSTNSLFVRNEELEALVGRNGIAADYETERLRISSGRGHIFYTEYYEYINGEFVLVKVIRERHDFSEIEGQEEYLYTIHFTHYELVDGELVVVSTEIRTEYLILD